MLCPWARHFTDAFIFMWQTGGGAKHSTRRGCPSVTEGMQTEHEC